MSEYFKDLNEIRIKLFKTRFTEELEHLMPQDLDQEQVLDDETTHRISELEEVIKLIEDGIKTKKLNEKKSLYDELDEINRQTYTRPWSRLPSYHKEIKLIEYVKESVVNEDTQKKLIDELISLVDERKITSSKHVIYDQTDCKIISLKCLNYNEEDDTYTLRL